MGLLLEHAPFNLLKVNLLASNQAKQVPAQDLIEVVVEEEKETTRQPEWYDNTRVYLLDHGLDD